MASVTIGRAPCPECGEPHAHVKRSDKCDYRWCPECGAQYYAKTPRQKADLAAKTTALRIPATGSEAKPAPAAPAVVVSVEAPATGSTATATPAPAAPARRGLFF
jgi:ssDNA-binding Zn-finger/Zn-ribbon topoisomerase 1